ncbi:MAG: DUF971 domain-containing protein [Pirellulales bacterium]
MTTTAYPVKLERAGEQHLVITWSDGGRRRYSIRELRDACPCATCREKRSAPPPSPLALPVLTDAQLLPLTLSGMQPVGNYAYGIAFSDGHDTGIFTLELLRELGEAV